MSDPIGLPLIDLLPALGAVPAGMADAPVARRRVGDPPDEQRAPGVGPAAPAAETEAVP